MANCYECGAYSEWSSPCPACVRANNEVERQIEFADYQIERQITEKIRAQVAQILGEEVNDATLGRLAAVYTAYPERTSSILAQIYANPLRRHLCAKVLFNFGTWQDLLSLELEDCNRQLSVAMMTEAEPYGRIDWLRMLTQIKDPRLLLDKVAAKGLHSLTDQERQVLSDASDRFKRRR